MANPTPQEEQARLQQMQATQNANFMRYTFEAPIPADAQNGTSYALGRNISFDVPIVSGAYATKLVIHHDLDVDVDLGTTGTAKLTASGETAAISRIVVTYGNEQIRTHPAVERIKQQLQGYNRTRVGQTIVNSSPDVQAMLETAPTLNDGVNKWKFDTQIDLNGIHPMSVNGIIPISSSGTRMKINLQTAGTFAGPFADPLDSCVVTTGDAVVNVGGKVTITVFYRSYESMSTRAPFEPNLAGLPTVQTIETNSISPMTANVWNYKSLLNPYPIVRTISFVIDGKSSETYCSPQNITGYVMQKDNSASSAFFRYDESTGGMSNYFRNLRDRIGGDLEDGVIVFDAPTNNVANASSRAGDMYWNLTESGYPAGRLGFKVASVDGSHIVPRVITFAQILNQDAIKLS